MDYFKQPSERDDADLKRQGFTLLGEALPKMYEPVIAVTRHFRCLALIDASGKWRHAGNNEELRGVIAWAVPRGREGSS